MKVKKKIFSGVIIMLLLLSGCTVNHRDNAINTTKESNTQNTHESIDIKNPEVSSEDEISEQDIQTVIDHALNNGETKLLWVVDTIPDMNLNVNGYDLKMLDREDIKHSLLTEVFKEYKIVSDNIGAENEQIELSDGNSNIMITFDMESNYFEISFADGILETVHEEILNDMILYVESVSKVECIETDYDVEEGEEPSHKYLFYPNGVLYDIKGRGDFPDGIWIAGSGLKVIEEDGRICVQGLAEFISTGDTMNPSDYLTLGEIQYLCEVDWCDYPIPAVAVAESMRLVYIVGKEGDTIIPAWQINGYYRMQDDEEKHILRIMIDAESGEIIQHS